MSYIITATILEDDPMNSRDGVRCLLTVPEIRLLSRDTENETVTLDMRGDYETNGEQVRWLCNKLVNAGILRFQIDHSY